MRSLNMWFYLAAVVCGLMLLGNPGAALAADNDDDGGKMEQKETRPPAHMMPGAPGGMCQAPSHGLRCHRHCALKVVLLLLAICHVLLAGWIYIDIRKRGEGHGVFIILALLAGFPAAVLYALVRIGDRKT